MERHLAGVAAAIMMMEVQQPVGARDIPCTKRISRRVSCIPTGSVIRWWLTPPLRSNSRTTLRETMMMTTTMIMMSVMAMATIIMFDVVASRDWDWCG